MGVMRTAVLLGLFGALLTPVPGGLASVAWAQDTLDPGVIDDLQLELVVSGLSGPTAAEFLPRRTNGDHRADRWVPETLGGLR